ncbi:MAG: response regulator [Pseudomonadales bacterium]
MLTVVAKQPESERPGVVLFVDDERRVLTSMRAMFRRGYKVLTADSAAEGLEIIRSQTVDVVVSDQRMPEMTGVEMLTQIRECSPYTMRILLTGYADLEAIEASINDCEVFRYLMKPCPPDQLRDAVSQALVAARAEQLEDAEGRSETADATVQPTADVVVLHQNAEASDSVPANLSDSQAVKVAAVEPSNDSHWLDDPDAEQDLGQVGVLVFSGDMELKEAICDAAQSLADGSAVYHAQSLESTLDLLATKPIGVLITDMAISERDVTALTTELKRQVPALVTILVAERSDASLLINLINHGQVFRFLLKPVPVGQCRLWLTSARKRHLELAASEAERLRYQPQALPVDEEIDDEDFDSDELLFESDYDSYADHSAVGIRERIANQLSSLKQRFSRWSLRNG